MDNIYNNIINNNFNKNSKITIIIVIAVIVIISIIIIVTWQKKLFFMDSIKLLRCPGFKLFWIHFSHNFNKIIINSG